MCTFAAVLLVMAVPFMPSSPEDKVSKELKSLEGKWKAVALEAGGKPLPKEAVPEFYFIVGAGGKATGKMGKIEYQSIMSVNPGKDPKTIDNAHETGQYQRKKQYGIYRMEAGKWIVCMTAPGVEEKNRPTSFDTTNSANVVFTFEKVSEGK